jgi:hypothetical protein
MSVKVLELCEAPRQLTCLGPIKLKVVFRYERVSTKEEVACVLAVRIWEEVMREVTEIMPPTS